MLKLLISGFACLWFTGFCFTQTISSVWSADNGDGTYKNPIIHADYSDPDAVRVGDDYYMISSSFNHVPGLPILHSKDLVNWQLIGHALPGQYPPDHFSKLRHGGGVWAPSLRYHNSEFYIYYPDPDFGIYLLKAKTISGPWSAPILVAAGKGLIDPCPLWDDDGKVYLTHAYAGSRAGIKSVIVVAELSADGEKLNGNTVMVFDGHETDPTIEGPKFYKRNGYYYIFAPGGGVSTGWQTILRSRKVYGPYERKVAMHQGNTAINGPHQGAWVDTKSGEDWFLHFQDKDAYGRIVHLQPMTWKNDWPVIGNDADGDGIGEPVMKHKKPTVQGNYPVTTIADSDEFNDHTIGLQWQWQANPKPFWAFPNQGRLRLYAGKIPEDIVNYWNVPNLLLQKFPAEKFTASTKLQFKPRLEEERAGLIVFGSDYIYCAIVFKEGNHYLQLVQCIGAEQGKTEQVLEELEIEPKDITLRVAVEKGAVSQFSYSTDGNNFTLFPHTFTAKPGKWVGAKVGLFCTGIKSTNDAGFADVDWFRFSSNTKTK